MHVCNVGSDGTLTSAEFVVQASNMVETPVMKSVIKCYVKTVFARDFATVVNTVNSKNVHVNSGYSIEYPYNIG